MLYMEPEDKKELLAILAWYKKYDVRAYSSQVKSPQPTYEPLELYIMRFMMDDILEHLQKTFSFSDLSFFVTIRPWDDLCESTKDRIKNVLLPLDQW